MLNYITTHPSIVIILASLILMLSKSNNKIFSAIAVLYPIIAWMEIYLNQGVIYTHILGIKFITIYDENNKHIGFAFLMVLICANLYALSIKRKYELIFGSLYGGFTILTLLTGDIITLFVSIELMMITSLVLIYYNNSSNIFSVTWEYFITHFVSGNLFLIGLIYLSLKSSSYEIRNIALLLSDNKNFSFVWLILLALSINTGMWPAIGWLPNCYSNASTASFPYLISFTSKISLIILGKFFCGAELLKYIGVATIIYTSWKILRENHLLTLLCYLSLIQIGFIVVLFGYDNQIIWDIGIKYLIIHIIYKFLLSIVVCCIFDKIKVEFYSDLRRISNKMILFGGIIGLAIMVNIPVTSGFLLKRIVNDALGLFFHYFVIFITIVTSTIIPLKIMFEKNAKPEKIMLNNYAKLSIIIPSIIAIFYGFTDFIVPNTRSISLITIPILKTEFIEFIKQTIIIILSSVIFYLLNVKRVNTHAFNIIFYLIDRIKKIFTNFQNKKIGEDYLLKDMERQYYLKLNIIFGDQRSFIFVLYSFIVLMTTI